MLNGFELSFSDCEKPLLHSSSSYKKTLELQKERIKESLNDLYLEDGSIDAKKLQNAWFPSMNDMHVFISHSHKDSEIAETLACWLYDKYNLNSFIDSHVWGYSNTLLNKLDKKYAYSEESKTYDYAIRNLTTSHVHMMLSASLSSMIDSCECLFFINTTNSISNIGLTSEINEERTPSPWIMFELMTSSFIRKRRHAQREHIIMEAKLNKVAADHKLPVFHHNAPKEHLKKITATDLFLWSADNNISKSNCKEHEQIEFKALDSLYTYKDKFK